MRTIIGIAGSLRRDSYNGALLRAAAALMPPGFELEVASLREVPLYDGDVESAEGVPAAVTRLKDRIAASAGLLLATPEYNNSVPGVLKNAIDWLSRPPADIPRVFGDRPIGLIGASTGAGGTRLSQAAWLPIIRTLGMRPWFGKSVYVATAKQVFDETGELIDPKTKGVLEAYVKGFTSFIGAQP